MKGKGNGMRNGMATAFILCMMGSMLLAGCGRAKSTPDLSTSAKDFFPLCYLWSAITST